MTLLDMDLQSSLSMSEPSSGSEDGRERRKRRKRRESPDLPFDDPLEVVREELNGTAEGLLERLNTVSIASQQAVETNNEEQARD